MSMARKHTQQALAAHDAQFSQQIKDMTARGDPLAPLAAATSSPETAQLIALQAVALSGQLNVADAARLNVAARGHETDLLDRLAAHTDALATPALGTALVPVREEDARAEEEDGGLPRQRYNGRRVTARLEATR